MLSEGCGCDGDGGGCRVVVFSSQRAAIKHRRSEWKLSSPMMMHARLLLPLW